MATTIDEVIETVRGAREEGLDALAAMALSYGAMMDFGVHRIRALRGQVLAAERGMEDARSGLAEVCAARDSARIRAERAESEAAQLRAERDAAITRAERAESERDAAHVEISRSTTRQLNTMRDERDAARAERDAAREALIARDSAPDLDYPAREALWKMRAERDAAIAEAESLRGELDALAEKLGAATLERDAARDEVTP